MKDSMGNKKQIRLPRRAGSNEPQLLRKGGRITIIGQNGSGKSRFMTEMMELCGSQAFQMSAIHALLPALEESTAVGSIDSLYRDAARSLPYMRADAVSQLDKLSYMLFADEFNSLLEYKQNRMKGNGGKTSTSPTRFDRLRKIWRKIFQDSDVGLINGRLTFTNRSGDSPVGVTSLSQGEKTTLYYVAASLYAPHNAAVFVDNPSLFIHPSILQSLWDAIEKMRPDCTFIYSAVEADFVASRSENVCLWVKRFYADKNEWDYDVVSSDNLSEQIFLELAGSRRPVLFTEGDTTHSIDKRLYSLVFPEYNIRPLGSCNKVIETTRSFNDLKYLHHLESMGIVDRDRRTDKEVEYLRQKNILVPDVAEVENIFLLEGVIKAVAVDRGLDHKKIIRKVKGYIIPLFREKINEQALQHVRHKMKRDVEVVIDSRFKCITALEAHINSLITRLNPRRHYNKLVSTFNSNAEAGNYRYILKVFNHKPMLGECQVAQLLGFSSRDEYIAGVIDILAGERPAAPDLLREIRACLGADHNPHSDKQ